MSIIATNEDNVQAVGVIEYPAGSFAANVSTTLDFGTAIASELTALNPGSDPSAIWRVSAYLGINCSGTTDNAGKFKGAYTRLDYGVVDFSYRGRGTLGYYWNYASQRFPNFSLSSKYNSGDFPSTTTFPSEGTFGTIVPIGAGSDGSDCRYATEVAILPISALASTISAFIYYFGQIDEPENPIFTAEI
jgi:hypothetical protein